MRSSFDKTLITHATTAAARFLGYEIARHHCDTRYDKDGRRSINGDICLRIPAPVVDTRCALYTRQGKPLHRRQLMNDSDFSIVERFQEEYRGYVLYYSLAHNIHRLHKLQWVAKVSLLKTLAAKHKASVTEIAKRYASTVNTPDGVRRCFMVTVNREGRRPLVARFEASHSGANQDAPSSTNPRPSTSSLGAVSCSNACSPMFVNCAE